MKRKRLALLLAVALTVTSVDSSALAVSGADFSSEAAEVETETEPQAAEDAAVNVTGEDTSEETVTAQETAEPEVTADDETDSEVTVENNETEETEIVSEDEAEPDLGDGEETDIVAVGDENGNGSEESNVESITVENLNTTEITAGFDAVNEIFKGATVTVNYNDGSEPYVEQFDEEGNSGATFEDSYGNYFSAYWLIDNELQNLDFWGRQNPGTYKLVFSNGNVQSDSTEINVVHPKNLSGYQGTMNSGETECSLVKGDVFSFTPEKSGNYRVNSCAEEGYNISNDATAEVEKDKFSQVATSGVAYKLEAGITYYFRIALYNTSTVAKVSISYLPEISSVQVDMDNVEKTEFMVGTEYCYLPGLQLTVNYGDKLEAQILTFEEGKGTVTDSYGNNFYYGFQYSTDSGYNSLYICGERLPAVGTYKVNIYANGTVVNAEYTVSVEYPENLAELNVGSNHIKSSDNDQYNWYTFIPSSTAKYRIGPVSNFEIYKKTETGVEELYPSGSEYCSCELEEKATYYFGFQGTKYFYDEENDRTVITHEWDVTIEEGQDISGLQFTQDEITLVEGLDSTIADSPFGYEKLTITYGAGETAVTKTTTPYLGQILSDDFGNGIYTHIYGSDGSEFKWDTEESDVSEDGEAEKEVQKLPIGTYKVNFTYTDPSAGEDETGRTITSNTITLNVISADNAGLQELQLGENTVKPCNENNDQKTWYKFVVPTAGEYSFSQGNNENNYEQRWRYVSKGKIIDPEVDEDNEFWGDWGARLQVGTYYVCWENSKPEDELTINISKKPEVESVTVKTIEPADMTFIEHMGIDISKLLVEVKYDDGKTIEIDRDYGCDDYDNYLNTKLVDPTKDEEDNYIDLTDDIPAGKYVYKVSFGGVYADDIPVRVISAGDLVKGDLKTDEATSVTNQDKLVLKYTAEATGRYELGFNVPLTNIKIRTVEDGYRPRNSVVESNCTYVNMEQGTTYYIYVQADEYCPELEVSVSLITRPAGLTATALKKNYIAGVDYFNESDMQTEVSYDGNTRTVRGPQEVDGYYLHYNLKDSDGNNIDYDGYYEPLSAGTYTVTPYLSASIQTGSAVAVEMSELPTTATTITAKKFENLKALPELKEDTWTDAEVKQKGQYYYFTAGEAGTYTWQIENVNSNIDVGFYRDGENEYEASYDYGIIRLEAGETCLVHVSALNDGRFKIVRKAEEEIKKPEEITSLELTDGMKKLIAYKGEEIPCTFTPEEDGEYIIESLPNGEHYSTSVTLKCDGKTIAEDGVYDEDDEHQFNLEYTLKAGKTYTYYPRLFYAENSGTIYLYFHKAIKKDIQSFKLVRDPDAENKDLTVFDRIKSYYNAVITYTDNTTYTTGIEDWFQTDEYGNEFYFEADYAEKDMFAENLTYNVTLCYRQDRNGDYNRITESLSVPGLGSFDKFSLGKEYQITKHEQYYIFTPEEDGEYICILNQENDGANHTGISECGKIEYGRLQEKSLESRWHEGETTFSVYLKAGQKYIVNAGREDDLDETTATFSVKKAAKTLKGLKLVKAPEQTTCLPNDVNAISLKGMQVEASYTDGSTETVTYGKADSDGRFLHHGGVKWLSNGKCRAYVNLGRYQVSFELDAASRDDVPQIRIGEKTELNAVKGDTVTVKVTADESASYVIDSDYCYISGEIGSDNADDEGWAYGDRYYMEAGKTYYVHFHVFRSEPTPTVLIKKYEKPTVTPEPTPAVSEKIEEVKKDLENIPTESDKITDEDKTKIDSAVDTITEISNEELVKDDNAMETVEKVEDLVVKANEKVAETEVKSEVGTVTVKGAALTAAKEAKAADENQQLAAKLSVTESANKYEDLGKDVLALDISLSIVDMKNDGKVVEGKEDVQPAAPIQITMPVPEKYQKRELKLVHIKGNGQEIMNCTVNADGTITFVVTSLSDYVLVPGKCTPGNHDYEETVIKPATCIEPGQMKKVCKICADEYTQQIDVDSNAHSYKWVTVKNPTCTAAGSKQEECEYCHSVKSTASIPATGRHTLSGWATTKEATAVAEGIQERKCTVCGGAKETRKTAKLKATVTLNVPTNKTLPLKVKQSFQIKADGLAKGDRVVSWSTDKKKILSVSAKGKIKGKKAGKATVTAKLQSGLTVRVKVKVQKKAVTTTAIQVLNKATGKKAAKKVNLKAKAKLSLVATVAPLTSKQKVTFTSSNKKVAAVNSKGVITAKKKGTATITIKSGKKSVKIKIKVK